MLPLDLIAADGKDLNRPPPDLRRCVGGIVWMLLAVSLAAPAYG
jgi:hypothetical protein